MDRPDDRSHSRFPALDGPGDSADDDARWPIARVRAAVAASLAVLIPMILLSLGVPARLAAWVHAQPGYAFDPDALTLDPAPPGWIKLGASGLVHRATSGDRAFEGSSALALDLRSVYRAFRDLDWVERVERVERSYPNKLTIRLAFRRPVAFAEYALPAADGTKVDRRISYTVDGRGFILPSGEELDRRSLPELLQIAGLKPPANANAGNAWAEAGDEPLPGSPTDRSARAEAASRLAAFIMGKVQAEGWPSSADGKPWRITQVNLVRLPSDRLHLLASDGRWILWGEAPGLETPGKPTADEKWRNLRDCIAGPCPQPGLGSPILSLAESKVAVQWLDTDQTRTR